MENKKVIAMFWWGLVGTVICCSTLAAAKPPVNWSTPVVQRLLAPGLVAHEKVTFSSSIDLSAPSIFIVPEIRPYVTVSTSLPSFISAGAIQSVDIVLTIPDSAPIDSAFEGTIHIMVGKRTIPSPLSVFFEVRTSAFKSPDVKSLIHDVDGTIYPVNQLLILLPTGASRSLAIDVANNIGAEIVGYSGAANVYQLELSTADKGTLNAVIGSLSADSRLRGVAKNFKFTLFSIGTDLANLGFCHPGFTDSYIRVKLLDAWNLTGASAVFVNIGIIDSGIDRTHPEFSHVSVRPADSLVSPNDTVGHGTAVSGIIGAGNDLTFSSCTPPFDVQMNGFISGVQGNYFLNVVSSSAVGAIFAINFPVFVDILAREGAQVINVSMGITKQEDLPFLPVNKATFDVITSTFRNTVQAYPSLLFAFSAGESASGLDAENVTPANLGGPTGEPNVLTVAATNLADERAVAQSWGSSNFGSSVDMSAPGVHLYAPTLFTAPLDSSDYVFFAGTSASAPMVTGTAAILETLGAGSPANLKYYLVNSGDPM